MATHLLSHFTRRIYLIIKIAWRLGISVYLSDNNGKGAIKSRPPTIKAHQISTLVKVPSSDDFGNRINHFSL